MISGTTAKSFTISLICYLYVLLFVYASVSKLLDFEKFQVQIGQSPLLSVFASWISWAVLITEMAASILLLIPRFRRVGLYMSLILMSMFTAYIFIILHYSSFVPCSCGGILEQMSWNVHLIFNIIFLLLSVLAIVLNESKTIGDRLKFKSSKIYIRLSLVVTASIFLMVFLFLFSEGKMHHENPFIRRYPHHPAALTEVIDLKYNSYYFAGRSNNRIYLANYEFPSYLLSMDSNGKDRKMEKINFSPGKIPFKIITIKVQDPYFYLYDRSVPVVFRGDIKNWIVNKEFKGIPYFTKAAPLDGTSIALRSNNSKNLANVLGVFNMDSMPKMKYKRDLLQRQIDGIFDTDGMLLYSTGLKKMIYLYYYRNEFIVADKKGDLAYRGHTIDTTTRARLKVSVLKKGKEFEMSSPPFLVNAGASVHHNLLFVHSKIQGRFENQELWKKSFIIDVYNLNNGSYLMSFPIYHTSSSILNSFFVTGDHFYAIIGNGLAVYKLNNEIRKEIN